MGPQPLPAALRVIVADVSVDGRGNHRPDGPKASHALTFKLDQSVGAGHAGSKHRFSTVVKNFRRIENWFHSSQFFYVDVTIDSVSLGNLTPRRRLALAYGAYLAWAAFMESAA